MRAISFTSLLLLIGFAGCKNTASETPSEVLGAKQREKNSFICAGRTEDGVEYGVEFSTSKNTATIKKGQKELLTISGYRHENGCTLIAPSGYSPYDPYKRPSSFDCSKDGYRFRAEVIKTSVDTYSAGSNAQLFMKDSDVSMTCW